MEPVIKRKEMMGRLVKDQVFKAALGIIYEGATLTMDAVASKSGLSKGSLYNYFENKKDLLAFVHETLIRPIREETERIYGSAIPPMEKIYAFVDSVFLFQKTYPLYFRTILHQRSAAVVINERISLTIRSLVRICRDGIRQGTFPDTDPYVMAAMIFGTVVGTMESLHHRDTPVNDMAALKQEILLILDRSLLSD